MSLTPQERLIWLLGDMMNAAENYFGAENPKRSGHINSTALRIIDEVIAPYAARIEQLEAALRKAVSVLSGEAMSKSSLIEALEAARAALAPEQEK
jgi:hypothetical protein